MLVAGCEDLHTEYTQHLESQKEGPKGMLKWCVKRANGQWHTTICAMINRLLGPETIDLLRLTKPSDHVFQFDDSVPALQQEAMLLREYSNLVLGLACQRAWSQAHYGLVFPYCLLRIMSSDHTEKIRAQALLRNMCSGILKLEDATRSCSEKSPLFKLLADVGTNNWVVTRELFIHGRAVDWDPYDRELREMAFSIGCGPTTTKNALENVLSTVKDAADRTQKNTKNMTNFSKWLYAATSHHPAAGGVEQIRVDRDDIINVPFNARTFSGKKLWERGGKSSFCSVFPSPDQILHKIRKAGYHANKQAAAACAYILKDTNMTLRTCRELGQETIFHMCVELVEVFAVALS